LANAWSTIDTTTAAKESKIDVLFNYIRDQRELTESTDPGFLRRVSWLYPIDGCWIRAAIVGHWAERENSPRLVGSLFSAISMFPRPMHPAAL
jgi:hypothetical protein